MKKQIQKVLSVGLLLSHSVSFAQESAAPSVRLVPLSSNKMYSALVIKPDLASAPELEQHLGKIQAGLNATTQKILSESVQSLVVAGGLNTVVAQISQLAKDEMSPLFMELNSKLPREAIYLNSYITPYDNQEGADLVPVPMVGSVQVLQQDMNSLSKPQKADFWYRLTQGIRDSVTVDREKFQLNAAAVSLKLERNYVAIQLQILGELQPGKSAFDKSNQQVKLDALNILSGPLHTDRPMALLTVTQRIPVIASSSIKRADLDTYKPEIRVEFGKFGGFAGEEYGVFHGKLQTFQNRYPGPDDCEMNMRSVPSLSGVFGEEPTGILVVDEILKNKKVRFRIQSISFDLQADGQLQISNMKVPMAIEENALEDLEVFQCLDLSSVNKQFGSEAQLIIDELVKKVSTQDNATPELMNAIYE